MTCSTCDNYRYIPDEQGMMRDCPDCRPDHLRCPLHGQMVITKEGKLAGKCWECVREAADGERWLETHPPGGVAA